MPRLRRRQLRPEQVQEVIEIHFAGEARVDALVHFFNTRGLWPEEELALAQADWKKQRMRSLIHRIKDKVGIRIYHHLRQRAENGVLEDVYVNEELMRPEQYAAVQADYYTDARYDRAIGEELGRRCYLRYGYELPTFEQWCQEHQGDDPVWPPDRDDTDLDDDPGDTDDPDDEDP